MNNRDDGYKMIETIKNAREESRNEKNNVRGKRQEYRHKLDAQLSDNRNRKDSNIMNKQEMAMNKADLEAYLTGDNNYKTMIPGIQPQA